MGSGEIVFHDGGTGTHHPQKSLHASCHSHCSSPGILSPPTCFRASPTPDVIQALSFLPEVLTAKGRNFGHFQKWGYFALL